MDQSFVQIKDQKFVKAGLLKFEVDLARLRDLWEALQLFDEVDTMEDSQCHLFVRGDHQRLQVKFVAQRVHFQVLYLVA